MKRFIFWICAAIAVVSVMTSCDKDEYIAAEPQPRYFQFVDATHINLFDQKGILCEEMRENECKINTQFEMDLIGDSPLVLLGENSQFLSLRTAFNEDITKDGGVIVSFTYNHEFVNRLRVYGLSVRYTDAMGNTYEAVCISSVYISCSMEVVKENDDPFYHEVIIHYKLTTDEFTLAEADQKVIVESSEYLKQNY